MVKAVLSIIILWFVYEKAIISNTNICFAQINQTKNLSESLSRSTPIEINVERITKYHNLEQNSIYNQVLSCSKNIFGDKYGRSTNVHETVHEINSITSGKQKQHRALYIGKNYVLWLKYPKVTMTDIIPNIPTSVRGYRFRTYFIENIKHWNDVALYPMDEWSAYIAGAECSVDDYNNRIFAEYKEDSVSGSLEFSIYCLSLAMSIKEKDPDYWNDYMYFRNSMFFFLTKAETVFNSGKNLFPSKKQDEMLKNLREKDDTKEMRLFLQNYFDNIFIK